MDLTYYVINAMLKVANYFDGNQMLEYAKYEDGSFKTFEFSDSSVEFMAPIDDEYDDINNYSLVAKITYGDVKILLQVILKKKLKSS